MASTGAFCLLPLVGATKRSRLDRPVDSDGFLLPLLWKPFNSLLHRSKPAPVALAELDTRTRWNLTRNWEKGPRFKDPISGTRIYCNASGSNRWGFFGKNDVDGDDQKESLDLVLLKFLPVRTASALFRMNDCRLSPGHRSGNRTRISKIERSATQ